MNDRDRSIAYSRGYNAGRRGKWPEHQPPRPPDELIAGLMEALQSLRDAVDGELGMLKEHDPWQETLGNPVDAVDQAMTRITQCLSETPTNPTPGENHVN